MRMQLRRINSGAVATHLVLMGYTVIAMAPVILVVMNSFKTRRAIFRNPLMPPTPSTFSLQGYETAFLRGDFGLYFLNSTIITLASLAIILAVGLMAAHAIVESTWKGTRWIALYFAIGLMIPIRLATVSLLQMIAGMDLTNSLLGLIIVYAAQGVPLSVLVLSEFLRQLPQSLKDAARIDGADEYRILFEIILPLVRAPMATVAIFSMMPIWNDLWFPLILAPGNRTDDRDVGGSKIPGRVCQRLECGAGRADRLRAARSRHLYDLFATVHWRHHKRSSEVSCQQIAAGLPAVEIMRQLAPVFRLVRDARESIYRPGSWRDKHACHGRCRKRAYKNQTGRSRRWPNPGRGAFSRAAELIDQLHAASPDYDIIGVGIGLCGALVDGAKLEPNMSNLPNLVGFDLAKEMPRRLRLPCRFGNDAQAALLAESKFGAIVGFSDAVCLALGTGIGSGLLLGGRLYRGAAARAGEIGAWVPDLGNIPSATLEDRAAPGSILRRTGRELGEMINAAAQDAHARKDVESFFRHVGGALANIQLLLDLKAAVICGGVTVAGDHLLDGISSAFAEACPEGYRRNFSIRLSVFGAWAGTVGAGCFWMED